MELENNQQAFIAALQLGLLALSKEQRERAIDLAYDFSRGMTDEQIEACKLIAKTTVHLEFGNSTEDS